MGQLRESRWVELNLVSGLGDACLLKRLPFGGKKKRAAPRTAAARTSRRLAKKRTKRMRKKTLMRAAAAACATTRSRRRQAAQTPGSTNPWRLRLRLTLSPALGAPDAPHRSGWSMTMASRASCRKPRLTHGRQPWPRRRARGPAAPPALAQHRSTHKA